MIFYTVKFYFPDGTSYYLDKYININLTDKIYQALFFEEYSTAKSMISPIKSRIAKADGEIRDRKNWFWDYFKKRQKINQLDKINKVEIIKLDVSITEAGLA